MRLLNRAVPYATAGKIFQVPIEDILPNPEQPRKAFRYEQLLELAQSIAENGIINPLTVMFRDGKPILIAGERRLRAAKLLGMTEVPCIERKAEGEQGALLALIENLQRVDMNCFEEAEGIRRLIEVYGLTQEEAATRIGCSQPTVANKLRLLKLPLHQREFMKTAGLTERHARALLRVEDEEKRDRIIRRVIAENMTVARTEQLVEAVLHPPQKPRRPVMIVKDVRLFVNTVEHAVETMRRAGVPADWEKKETPQYIEYTVRIPCVPKGKNEKRV